MARPKGSKNKVRGRRSLANQLINTRKLVIKDKEDCVEVLQKLKQLKKQFECSTDKTKQQTEKLIGLYLSECKPISLLTSKINFDLIYGMDPEHFYGVVQPAPKRFDIFSVMQKDEDLADIFYPLGLVNSVMISNSVRAKIFIPYKFYKDLYAAMVVDDLKNIKRRELYHERMVACQDAKWKWKQIVFAGKPRLGRPGRKMRPVSVVLKPLEEYEFVEIPRFHRPWDLSYIKTIF